MVVNGYLLSKLRQDYQCLCAGSGAHMIERFKTYFERYVLSLCQQKKHDIQSKML